MELMPTLETFSRAYLALFFTGVALFYTGLIIYKKRQLSEEVVFPGNSRSCTWWNHMVFRLFRMTIWLVCLLRWPLPEIDNYLYQIPVLKIPVLMITGHLLLTFGFFWAVVTNHSLGSEWRSGINPVGPTQLKTNGLYRYSRNPMYLSVAIAQLGFFLALPSLFTLICLAAGWVSLHVQILAEEKHLSERFAHQYQDYAAKVARWL